MTDITTQRTHVQARRPEQRSPLASDEPAIRMLRTAMGAAIAAALEDPDVVEIILNPDGTLWFDRLATGRAPMGISLSRGGRRTHHPAGRRASCARKCIRRSRSLTAELPETGERFEGVLPPVAPGPPSRSAQARGGRDPRWTTTSPTGF